MERSFTHSGNFYSSTPAATEITYTRSSKSSGRMSYPSSMRRSSSDIIPSSPLGSLSRRQQGDSGFIENIIPGTPPRTTMPSLTSPGGDCPKHPQERLKYYCQLHDELVCADCLAMEQRHQGHVHTRADDLADDYRRSLHSQLQPLQDLHDSVQTALKTMSSRRKEISANGDSVKEGVKTTVTKLHAFIDAREQDLLEEVEKITQQKLKHHDAHQTYLEGLSSELSRIVDAVSQTLSDNSGDILHHHKQLSEWVLEGTRKFQSLPKEVFLPLQGANINFLPDPAAIEACQTIGSVSERQADPLRCYIDETNLSGIVSKQEAVLHLLIHDTDGKPYTSHVRGIKVDFSSTTTNIPVDVTIEQDSSKKHQYNVTFTPCEAGQHVMRIKIGSTPVQNSPLVFNVGAVVHGTLVGDIKGVLQPYGIVVNDHNEVIIVENGKDCVSVFRTDGKNIRTISGKGKQKFNRPRGVTIMDSNYLLVTDDDGLKQCTQEGKHFIPIGKQGAGPLEFSFPCGVAVNRDGKIYVCDTFNCRIQILNPDLSFHQYLGNDHNPPGRLNQPYDIAFNSSGRIFIADYGDDSIKMFSPTGEFIGQITTKANEEPIKNPVSVHVNANNHVFVGEEKTSGLSIYDSSGRYLTMIQAKLTGAYGLATDSQGCVYVSDRSNRRIQIFK